MNNQPQTSSEREYLDNILAVYRRKGPEAAFDVLKEVLNALDTGAGKGDVQRIAKKAAADLPVLN